MKKFLGCVLIGILLGGGIVFLGMRINTRSSENFLAGTGNSPFQLFSQESDLEIVEAARQEFGACYAFSTLTAEEQLIYYRIYQAIMGHTSLINIDTSSSESVENAWRAMSADHAEMFWTNGYSCTEYQALGNVLSIDFEPKYTMSFDERLHLQEQVDIQVAYLLSGINTHATDYEKVKYVFDYLASSVDYELYSPNNQNILSVFLNQKTVCQGYSNAMQYLLHLLGVQSTVVTGTAGGEAHAWNLVRMDGNYYYVDTTLGNSTYSDDSGIAHRYVNYNYFGITTEELLKTHIPKDYYELPECTSIENNFYVKEGLYVTEWAPSIIGGICKAAYEREHSLASVKFSTRELYEQAKTYFIKGNHIADYCDIEKLQYIANYRHYILTFKLK